MAEHAGFLLGIVAVCSAVMGGYFLRRNALLRAWQKQTTQADPFGDPWPSEEIRLLVEEAIKDHREGRTIPFP